MRDLLNLDLMPFYNCFSNKFLKDHYINITNVEYEQNKTIDILASEWSLDDESGLYKNIISLNDFEPTKIIIPFEYSKYELTDTEL